MNVREHSTLSLRLPTEDGRLEHYTVGAPRAFAPWSGEPFTRVVYSAAHVVADPLVAHHPWIDTAIDWDQTMEYRHHLWSLGLGVAEAMDTAQRGMGLDWPTSLELIKRSLAEARHVPGALIASGAGTDHLVLDDVTSLDQVIAAYEQQIEAIEGLGGKIILMASRALARVAKSPEDYHKVYDRILSQVRQPVVIHWLGEMFDPALAGYWGDTDHLRAMDVAVAVINDNASKIDGVKISLLDKDKEVLMRRRLADGVKMYTGDDFNYAELIAGDDHGHSHALLGIFDAIAPAASAAMTALAKGDTALFHDILAPTVPLSRHIFAAPTRFYKTGVVFMAYLNGMQDHFAMIGGQQSTRSLPHLAQLFRLADKAGLLRQPDLAVTRMRHVLALHGVHDA